MSHRLLCRMLRGELAQRMASGRVGTVACRATAALYTLLLEHPVDHRGRCASCGWAGVVLGRRRRCRIYRVAQYWLRPPDPPPLLSRLAGELGLRVPPPPVPGPAPERPGLIITGRTGHGRSGEHPERPRPRRGPPDAPADAPADAPHTDPSAGPGAVELIAGGAPCLA